MLRYEVPISYVQLTTVRLGPNHSVLAYVIFHFFVSKIESELNFDVHALAFQARWSRSSLPYLQINTVLLC